MPWSLFACKDSILVLGDWNDEDRDDVHNDGDNSWPDNSFGDTDSSEAESVDDTEIGGACLDTVPMMHQAHESYQYGEMLGRAAQFGRPYLSHENQEHHTADTFKGPSIDPSKSTVNRLGSSHHRAVPSSAHGIPGASRDPAVSSMVIRNSGGDIDIPGTSSETSLRGTTTTIYDGRQETKRVQKRFTRSGGSGAKDDFSRMKSFGKASQKGGKRQLSDPDDDDDSTSDPSSSEDDVAPDIDLVRRKD